MAARSKHDGNLPRLPVPDGGPTKLIFAASDVQEISSATPLTLTEPQQETFLKPADPPPSGEIASAQLWVELVCHVIDIAGGEPA